jgi:hypothetical protein
MPMLFFPARVPFCWDATVFEISYPDVRFDFIDEETNRFARLAGKTRHRFLGCVGDLQDATTLSLTSHGTGTLRACTVELGHDRFLLCQKAGRPASLVSKLMPREDKGERCQ